MSSERPSLVVIAITIAIAAAACSRGSADAPGGDVAAPPGDSNPDAAAANDVGPHPVCPGDELAGRSGDIGFACEARVDAGCAYATNQCDTSLCLADDGDPASAIPYCTTTCSGEGEAGCPFGYECVKTGCTDASHPLFACRAPAPATPSTCTKITTIDPDLNTWAKVAVTAKGRLYAANRGAMDQRLVVVTRDPATGRWSRAGVIEPVDDPSPSGWPVGEDVFYIESRTLGDPIRFFAATPSRVTKDVLLCEGERCPTGLVAILRVDSAAGPQARAIVIAADDATAPWLIARDAGGTWRKIADVDATFDSAGKPFSQTGLVAVCTKPGQATSGLCTSLDGAHWEAIALPAGESFHELIAAGESPDDFWIISSTSTTFHWKNHAWLREGAPPGTTLDPLLAEITRTGDGTIYVTAESSGGGWVGWMLDAGGACWHAMDARIMRVTFEGTPFDAGQFVSLEYTAPDQELAHSAICFHSGH